MLRTRLRQGLMWLLGIIVTLARRIALWVREHPRTAAKVAGIAALVLLMFGLAVWKFASITADRALAEEREFWAQAQHLTLEQRTMIRNDMVRTGRVPHLLPWWEMDEDRCAAAVWKLVNLTTGIRLTHGKNGAAWMLRKQNPGKLRTVWDVSNRFDENGKLNSLEATVTELRSFLDTTDPRGVYLIGFRYAHTFSGSLIKRDKADLNSHVVMMTGEVFFHMFRYGNSEDPIVAELQEHFFAYNSEMQPVWVAQVMQNGHPFRFLPTDRKLVLKQHVYPWKSLKLFLRVPDFSRGVNALERSLLYWFRDGYEMYPELP